MKRIFRILALGFGVSAVGCSSGYTESGGTWSYIALNGNGREVRKIDADVATFQVLSDPAYAKDKNHVYKYGNTLEGFDGATFEFLTGNDYSRDAHHVYYRDSIVLDADATTFRVLGFPYGRDANHIYCGSLRMNVENPDEFKVIESHETGTFNTGETDYFYSTKDLVRSFGPEFADHTVKYDDTAPDMRYRIASSFSGHATDGVWLYEGPKRSRRVQPAEPPTDEDRRN